MNIRDIAKIAGVGVSTVSRVINNHPDVKDDTRKKILQIIKDSNYIPNNSARILKQNNTKNIEDLLQQYANEASDVQNALTTTDENEDNTEFDEPNDMLSTQEQLQETLE